MWLKLQEIPSFLARTLVKRFLVAERCGGNLREKGARKMIPDTSSESTSEYVEDKDKKQ